MYSSFVCSASLAGQPKPPATAPAFTIVHSQSRARFDGGALYYVLIPKPNLQTPAFKDQVKTIIKRIVAEHGGKISIDIYDDQVVLEGKFQKAVRSKAQLESDAIHFIAGFSGQLSTEPYPNTLYFFPGGFKQSPVIGKWVEINEFNPR